MYNVYEFVCVLLCVYARAHTNAIMKTDHVVYDYKSDNCRVEQ